MTAVFFQLDLEYLSKATAVSSWVCSLFVEVRFIYTAIGSFIDRKIDIGITIDRDIDI